MLSYSGIGFILLAFCGVGFWVSRNLKDVIARLDLRNPGRLQIIIAIVFIFITFAYDGGWALCTHNLDAREDGAGNAIHRAADRLMMGNAAAPPEGGAALSSRAGSARCRSCKCVGFRRRIRE